MKSLSLITLGLVAAAMLPSCVSVEKAAPPVATLQPVKNCPASKLEAGRGLYLGKCTKCHSPEVITDYGHSEWTADILPSMSKKAKLSATEAEDLRTYVLTVCSQKPQS